MYFQRLRRLQPILRCQCTQRRRIARLPWGPRNDWTDCVFRTSLTTTQPQTLSIVDHRTPQGLTDVGQLKAGETLVVSGAAGATGSVVCQLGKIIGAKVIAIAGTDDKCKWLEDELGVDKALNYKNQNFVNDFKQSVGYLDVYFDNGRRFLYPLVCIHR